ncbi:MAG TPA: aldo/keto reductase [Baekduia sp.]|jgi:aryl-alcohol dehydrogenase-like predicted oxidoreductase|nr:aldo/keto reductase [Baekduia sp.]
MNYRPLGRTGVQVSELCLGTMMFGAWGNTDHDDAIRIIHHALDAGINFVDTADIYSAGESEEIVGKALKGRRDDVVLATKFWGPMGEGPNKGGVSRRWIISEVESSLRRLGTDWIDLYQMHRPVPGVDIDETLGALTDLVRQGKVRYIGSSSFSAGEIVEAQWVARDRGRERLRTEQPPYSLLVRGIELDVLPTAERHGMGILTYSPLAGGWLSGNWTADSSPTSPARQRLASRFDMALPDNQRKLDAVQQPPTSPMRPACRSSSWPSPSSSTIPR